MKKENIDGLHLLEELKNSARIEKEGLFIRLIFKKKIEVSDSERTEVFTFKVPTLENIENALESTSTIENEQLAQLKQSYFLISSQFIPQFHPNDISERLSIDELKIFNQVLEPFLS